jgi:hypothetical protein
MPKMPRMTPDEANALVERLGSNSAAARHAGVPRTTFIGWLHSEEEKEKRRARARAKYRENPEKHREKARRQYWLNPDPKREWAKEQYWNFTGLELAERRLRIRRLKALKRMAARNRRRQNEAA